MCGTNKIYCMILLFVNPSLLALANYTVWVTIGLMPLVEMIKLSSLVILTMLIVLFYHVNARKPDKLVAVLVFMASFITLWVIFLNVNSYNSRTLITMSILSGLFLLIAIVIHFSLMPG